MEKIDRVFLRAFDYQSSRIRAEIDFNAIFDDDFRGKDGQKIFVFSALGAKSSKDLLSRFEINSEVPVVLTYDGLVIEKAKNVITHLRRNKATRD